MDQKTIEDRLFRLAGLTWDQKQDLQLACSGGLKKINGARAKAMKALIDTDLHATKAGLEMCHLIELLAEQEWYVGPRNAIEYDSGQDLVKYLHQWRCGWLRPVHMKALVAIYNDGSLSERFLQRIYGGRTTDDLLKFGMVCINNLLQLAEGWRTLRLSSAGDKLIQDYAILLDRKTLL